MARQCVLIWYLTCLLCMTYIHTLSDDYQCMASLVDICQLLTDGGVASFHRQIVTVYITVTFVILYQTVNCTDLVNMFCQLNKHVLSFKIWWFYNCTNCWDHFYTAACLQAADSDDYNAGGDYRASSAGGHYVLDNYSYFVPVPSDYKVQWIMYMDAA